MFKGIMNLASLLKDAQQFQQRAAELQERLGQVRSEGSAGGEMVVVTANGMQRLTGIRIEPSLLDSHDAEMLEDLLLAATNQALDKARDAAAAEMAKLTSNVDLSGIGEMLSKLGLGGPGTGSH